MTDILFYIVLIFWLLTQEWAKTQDSRGPFPGLLSWLVRCLQSLLGAGPASHCTSGSESQGKWMWYKVSAPQAILIDCLCLLPFQNPYYNFYCYVMAFNMTKV